MSACRVRRVSEPSFMLFSLFNKRPLLGFNSFFRMSGLTAMLLMTFNTFNWINRSPPADAVAIPCFEFAFLASALLEWSSQIRSTIVSTHRSLSHCRLPSSVDVIEVKAINTLAFTVDGKPLPDAEEYFIGLDWLLFSELGYFLFSTSISFGTALWSNESFFPIGRRQGHSGIGHRHQHGPNSPRSSRQRNPNALADAAMTHGSSESNNLTQT